MKNFILCPLLATFLFSCNQKTDQHMASTHDVEIASNESYSIAPDNGGKFCLYIYKPTDTLYSLTKVLIENSNVEVVRHDGKNYIRYQGKEVSSVNDSNLQKGTKSFKVNEYLGISNGFVRGADLSTGNIDSFRADHLLSITPSGDNMSITYGYALVEDETKDTN